MYKEHPAFILGLFETGLGVARSLGRKGIKVYGFDYKKDIAWYSKYVKPVLCPHPVHEENAFIKFLIKKAKNHKNKPILYLTSDEFIPTIIKNTLKITRSFLVNLPDSQLIDTINNKFKQYLMARKAGISVPSTFLLDEFKRNPEILNVLQFPVFIKGLSSNEWRKVFGGSKKGFVIRNKEEFRNKISIISQKNINVIVQELIIGPDTNHFKFNGYVDKSGKLRAAFCLRKIRQNPIHYGVGSLVESIYNEDLMNIGIKLFESINYRGIGSAEFKYDEKDKRYKLIELNPRFWQQNSLATACGINFPLIQYKDLTGQLNHDYFDYLLNIKWVNIYSDFNSYLSYQKEGTLNFWAWIKSLKGKKVFSDWAEDDIMPSFYEVGFGKKLIKIPLFLFKRLFN